MIEESWVLDSIWTRALYILGNSPTLRFWKVSQFSNLILISATLCKNLYLRFLFFFFFFSFFISTAEITKRDHVLWQQKLAIKDNNVWLWSSAPGCWCRFNLIFLEGHGSSHLHGQNLCTFACVLGHLFKKSLILSFVVSLSFIIPLIRVQGHLDLGWGGEGCI